MCGIVGLFLKDKSLEPQLGAMLSDMLVIMTDRGPDSAGIAIYGAPSDGRAKLTVQSAKPATDFAGLEALLKPVDASVTVELKSSHAVIETATAQASAVRDKLAQERPDIRVMGSGDSVEIYKEVGLPKDVVARFGDPRDGRHARHRPHPHGDRIGRHHARRASVLDRRRPVPRAQWLAVQPQQPAPRTEARRHDLRDRERLGSRRRLSDRRDGQGQGSRRRR